MICVQRKTIMAFYVSKTVQVMNMTWPENDTYDSETGLHKVQKVSS